MRSYRFALSVAGLGIAIAAVMIIWGVRHNRISVSPNAKNFQATAISKKKKFVIPAAPAIYQISEAAEDLPKMIEAKIDPTDVHVGDIQNFYITLSDPNPITSVVAKIQTDHHVKEVELAEDFSQARNDKVYKGSWKVADTHDTTYRTTFVARDSKGRENSITLAWSDACSIPNSGNWSISSNSNCTLSAVDGVDNGDATIDGGVNNGTLTLNSGATFAFNPGHKITITTGHIALASGAQIKETYLWKQDADSDTYPGATEYAQTNDPGPGYARRYTWAVQDDCYDFDANAYPGEPNYYASPVDFAPNYDWNCDGINEEQYQSTYTPRNCTYVDPGDGGPAYCQVNTPGTAGWQTSVPACGQTAYYIDGQGCIVQGTACIYRDSFTSGNWTQYCR